MFVEFWNVGSTESLSLPMTPGNVSAHLLADWVPSLPAAVGSSFIGWPPFLLEVVSFNNREHLTLREETRRSERQWKGVLSWMLGVAGTRHFLESDNYRWIAPLSAFYPEAFQEVDLSQWHHSFQPSSVQVTRPNPNRLRPDYLALRSTAGGMNGPYQWAVVESKVQTGALQNYRIVLLNGLTKRAMLL